MQRPNRKLVKIPVEVFCVLLLCLALATNLCAQQQNGISATEGAAISGRTAGNGIDYLWADSTALRWMVSLDGNSAQPLMAWPCTAVGQLGGIVYSGTAPSGSNTNAESCLPLPATIDPGVPLLVGSVASAAPQWGGSSGANAISLNLQSWASVAEVLNDTTTGTIANNTLAKITTTGAMQAGTGDGTIPTYVVVSGSGTSGNAQLALSGQAPCKMDATHGSSVEGQPVFASTVTAGDCSTAATAPLGGWVVGQMISTTTTAGSNATILTRPGGFWLLNAAGGTVLGNTTASSAIPTYTNAPVLGVSSSGTSPTTGTLKFFNSANTGSVTLSPSSSANNATLTLPDPASNDTLVGQNTSDTLTNKTLVSASSGNKVTLVCGAGPQSEMNGNGSVQTFISCSIPASLISTGSVIKAHVVWQHSTVGSNSITYNWIFGTGTSTTYSCGGTPCNQTATVLSDDLNIYETGANAQQMEAGSANGGNAFVSSSHSLTSQTQTVSNSLTVGYQFTVATGDKVTGNSFT